MLPTKRKGRARNLVKKLNTQIKVYYVTHRFCFILIASIFTEANIVLCRARLINSNHLSYTRYLIVKSVENFHTKYWWLEPHLPTGSPFQ